MPGNLNHQLSSRVAANKAAANRFVGEQNTSAASRFSKPGYQSAVAQNSPVLPSSASMPVQRTKDDAVKFLLMHKDEFYEIDTFQTGIFNGCKQNEKWWNKWEINGEVVTLKQHVKSEIDKTKVEEWVKNKAVPAKLRKGLLDAWNENQGEKGEISQDAIADLVMDVSTISMEGKTKLTRSDSFTFEDNTGVPDPAGFLNKMTTTVRVQTGDSDNKQKIPLTDSLPLAALFIRAYGDDLNVDKRKAGNKFVFNLGGAHGIYRDAMGNGDLFYYPLSKNEKGVYAQEGNSSSHTWDNLAAELGKLKNLEDVNVRLAEVLLGEFDGKLSLPEATAIGAMLADAKYSIQGLIYAAEQFKAKKFTDQQISTLFDVVGMPMWKYSLNASHEKNAKIPDDEKGRRAGLGYKKLDLKKQAEEKKKKRAPEAEKKLAKRLPEKQDSEMTRRLNEKTKKLLGKKPEKAPKNQGKKRKAPDTPVEEKEFKKKKK